ncbi:MAG: hypothetical protein ABW224_09135 [Kibdelosporangium sp.]
MSPSSSDRARVRALLQPGERISYLFPASMVGGPYSSSHFLVAVTDTSITVLDTGLDGRTQPNAVWRRYPRRTKLGPVDLSVIPEFQLGGRVYEVDEEYVAEIHAADAEWSADAMPPDPLPHL